MKNSISKLFFYFIIIVFIQSKQLNGAKNERTSQLNPALRLLGRTRENGWSEKLSFYMAQDLLSYIKKLCELSRQKGHLYTYSTVKAAGIYLLFNLIKDELPNSSQPYFKLSHDTSKDFAIQQFLLLFGKNSLPFSDYFPKDNLENSDLAFEVFKLYSLRLICNKLTDKTTIGKNIKTRYEKLPKSIQNLTSKVIFPLGIYSIPNPLSSTKTDDK